MELNHFSLFRSEHLNDIQLTDFNSYGFRLVHLELCLKLEKCSSLFGLKKGTSFFIPNLIVKNEL